MKTEDRELRDALVAPLRKLLGSPKLISARCVTAKTIKCRMHQSQRPSPGNPAIRAAFTKRLLVSGTSAMWTAKNDTGAREGADQKRGD
jgi:hypothetical protein